MLEYMCPDCDFMWEGDESENVCTECGSGGALGQPVEED